MILNCELDGLTASIVIDTLEDARPGSEGCNALVQAARKQRDTGRSTLKDGASVEDALGLLRGMNDSYSPQTLHELVTQISGATGHAHGTATGGDLG